MTSKDSDRLAVLLREIEATLLDTIPETILKLRIDQPAYCLFIWYYDTTIAGDYTPQMGVGLQVLREACINAYSDGPNDYIWRPQQTISSPFPGFPYPFVDCEGPGIAEKCNECYRLMDVIYGSDMPLADERPMLKPFIDMICRVAQSLNRRDWRGVLASTDDFVVIGTDYIGYWLLEDIEASVPAERHVLLESRGCFDL